MSKRNTAALTLREWERKRIFGTTGLMNSTTKPYLNENVFVNDPYNIEEKLFEEYNVWYSGVSDRLLSFYTYNEAVDFNTEPYYYRNKQSYFWAVASTEGDIKRTHSGQPRNIVDTLVNIVGVPHLSCANENVDKTLQKILKENKFKKMFLQEQLPLTLVLGRGCYKINWDTSISDYPIVLFYRADACEFISQDNRIVAIIFKDYYYDEEGQKYLLLETRRVAKEDGVPCLFIEKELFVYGQGESLVPKELKELPQLKDVVPAIKVSNYRGFLAVPCIIYEDSDRKNAGRSIFSGKLDLFDDLDQCLSQSANTVRRSTVREYFNSNYLEHDPDTGMPVQPKAFDRKYTLYSGGRDAQGGTGIMEPVQVTQPVVNFAQYDAEAISILTEIIAGIISPATLGIDIAKKDNAEAQREKEKVTIFTRNTIIGEETEIHECLCRELLCANQLMHNKIITERDYDISVKFDEFADASFEAKLSSLMTAFNGDVMTPELFVEKLYGDSLSKVEKEEQVEYIKGRQELMAGMSGMMGGFGELGADGNGYNLPGGEGGMPMTPDGMPE